MIVVLRLLHVCFLIIGCVGLVYLLKLCVIGIYDFNLAFGNHYVSVLIHVLPCQLRTIHRQMGLQNVTIVRLNSYFVVTAVLSSLLGVSIWRIVSLL